MSVKLKQFRTRASLSQAKLAKAVGVSQPNYQRWESGAAPIPEDKLTKLAHVLETTTDALLGRHPPMRTVLYNRNVSEELNYYGEMTVHFVGGGKPLLLSISDGEFKRAHLALQGSPVFLTVRSLANQTAIIRTAAVADLYFSGEACDDFGPEHDDYEDDDLPQIPDARDWEIIEALQFEESLDDFSAEDVERVSGMVMITDEQYDMLVQKGRIKEEDLEGEKKKNLLMTERIFSLANEMRYQLSDGKRRAIHAPEDEALFDAFWELVDFGSELDDVGDGLLYLSLEGWHKSAFINKSAFDYITVPTHRLERGEVDFEARSLDEDV